VYLMLNGVDNDVLVNVMLEVPQREEQNTRSLTRVCP